MTHRRILLSSLLLLAAMAPWRVAVADEFAIPTADEAVLRADVPSKLNVFRFAANPDIVVLDFASLHAQGLMLDRVAALIEKASAPRYRVLDDVALAAAIARDDETIDTYYSGHDYSAASLRRFFSLAAEEHVRLNDAEAALRRLLLQLGWLAPGVRGGLISLPRAGESFVTTAMRAAILHHELSHGEYFSNAAYAAYVHRFWQRMLTAAERDDVRQFLAAEAYDVRIETLVENEMQAYLMFTRNPAFFTATSVGMSDDRLRALQLAFLRDMPGGWLRDDLAASLSRAATAAR